MEKKAYPFEYKAAADSFISTVSYSPSGTVKKRPISHIKSSDHVVEIVIRDSEDTKERAAPLYKLLRDNKMRAYVDPSDEGTVLRVAFYSREAERVKNFLEVLGQNFMDNDATYQAFIKSTCLLEKTQESFLGWGI